MLFEILLRRDCECATTIDRDDDGTWYIVDPCSRLVLAGMQSREDAENVYLAITRAAYRPSLWGELRLLLRELFR